MHRNRKKERKKGMMFILSRKKKIYCTKNKNNPEIKKKERKFNLIFEDFQLYIFHFDLI
jgi:hypothetical protein